MWCHNSCYDKFSFRGVYVGTVEVHIYPSAPPEWYWRVLLVHTRSVKFGFFNIVSMGSRTNSSNVVP